MNNFTICPFTIVVDSNEQAPFPFAGFRDWKTKKGERRPLVVETVRKPLWNLECRDVEVKGETHNVGYADYSIVGYETAIAIERKSMSDLFATLGSRRGRFEAQIKRMHEDCDFAAVVVEGDYGALLTYTEHGPSPKSVFGTIGSWEQRYNTVHWWLCPTRAFAEIKTFDALQKFWRERE